MVRAAMKVATAARRRGVVLKLDGPLNEAQAIKRIRKCLKEGCVTFSEYAARGLSQRGLNLLDLECLARSGSVVGKKQARGEWEYRVKGKLIGGVRGIFVVNLRGPLLVIRRGYRRR